MHKNILALPLILLALLIFSPSASAHNITKPSADEKAMLAKINQGREARDLRPLKFEGKLTQIARWMNKDMIQYDYFGHVDHFRRNPFRRMDAFGYRGISWRGENLAAGNYAVNPTYSQWWNSAPHKQNMLNPNYRYVGLSRICDEDSTYNCYWTTEFGGHWTHGFVHP